MSSPENHFRRQPENHETTEELLHLPIDLTDIEVDPETFKRTLIARQEEIIENIQRTYEETLHRFPGYTDSKLPGSLVAVLSRNSGPRFVKVIEKDAYWANNSGGIYRNMRDLKPKYHPYWLAVQESGFIPEVRTTEIYGRSSNLYARVHEDTPDTEI